MDQDRSSGRNEAEPARCDVLVLGAGISGLVTASVLVEQGAGRVIVVDEYDHVGGNHIDRSHGGYTFDVGCFIFQDDSPLLRHFPELLPRYLPIEPTWARINPQGTVTQYPFSVRDDLVAAGAVEGARILLSAAYGRAFRRRVRNARDFARHWIGARLLYRSGLESYMERFCGLPAERIDLKFAETRMMWIAEYASVRNLVRRFVKSFGKRRSLLPTNHQLARPEQGFAHLYAPAVRRLEDNGVTFLLAVTGKSLRKLDGEFRLDLGDRTVIAGRVVSTIPLDHALGLCDLPIERRLPTVTLLSLFFSFSGSRRFDASVLYNFDHAGAWKRLTMYSDFYGRVDDREYFAVEVLAERVGGSAEQAEADFRRHAAEQGLFDGDLQMEGTHLLPNAYPIYTEGAGDQAERAITALRAWGVESFGRQGGFQYQPTARASTIEAETALRPVSRGGPQGH